MENRPVAPYRLMASSIHVDQIATPIACRVGPDEDQNKVFSYLKERYWENCEDDWHTLCIVCDGTGTFGYLTFEDVGFAEPEPGQGRARDVAIRISADRLISASTPILELPSLFVRNELFFVLTGNEITHFVRLQDADKLPMQLALFALILELESEIIEFLLIDEEVLKQQFAAFPEKKAKNEKAIKKRSKLRQTATNRRVYSAGIAESHFTRRGELEARLLATDLADKKDLLTGIPAIRDRLPFRDGNQYDSAFKNIIDIRNQIAHGNSIWNVLGNAADLNSFVLKLNEIIVALRETRKDIYERKSEQGAHTDWLGRTLSPKDLPGNPSSETATWQETHDQGSACAVKEEIEESPRPPLTPAHPVADNSETGADPGREHELTVALAPGVEMTLVCVPASEFVMGSGRTYRTKGINERPQQIVYLDEYYIGKYPVTVAQFATFVDATGYRTTAEQAGSGYIRDERDNEWWDANGAYWRQPMGPASSIQACRNHPVQLISWDDAVAFCEWASQDTGIGIRLPTEAQWEKAARGTDGREYPWGNENPRETTEESADIKVKTKGFEQGRCNFDGTGTTPVGQYSPLGDSPYGCADMAGNVWEWCADWYEDSYPAIFKPHNPTGPDSGEYRVLRGGSFYTASACCIERRGSAPSLRTATLGFRVSAFHR